MGEGTQLHWQAFQASHLKARVVEVASFVELVLEKLHLGFVGIQAVFVGEAHKQEYTKSIDLRQTKSEDAGTCKRAAFPCRLKATVPRGKFYGKPR